MIRDGILNIYKPQNMTSHDVVAIVRKATGMKRVGHTGTLDPMATGVLPVCIGRATRVMEYLDMDIKTYRCTMKLGLVTDTEDIWGEVLQERDFSQVTEEEVLEAFGAFKGVVEQVPPMYSALKVNGKKLYEYAREGKNVDIKKRKIYIKDLKVDFMELEEGQVGFLVSCTKGTYIRSICRDAGEALGCGAVMDSLERVSTGVFDKEASVNLEDLREMTPQEIEGLLQPIDSCLTAFGEVVLDEESAFKFLNGMRISATRLTDIAWRPQYEERDFYLPIREEYRRAYNVYGPYGGKMEFLGVGFVSPENGSLKADKIFCVGR